MSGEEFDRWIEARKEEQTIGFYLNELDGIAEDVLTKDVWVRIISFDLPVPLTQEATQQALA